MSNLKPIIYPRLLSALQGARTRILNSFIETTNFDLDDDDLETIANLYASKIILVLKEKEKEFSLSERDKLSFINEFISACNVNGYIDNFTPYDDFGARVIAEQIEIRTCYNYYYNTHGYYTDIITNRASEKYLSNYMCSAYEFYHILHQKKIEYHESIRRYIIPANDNEKQCICSSCGVLRHHIKLDNSNDFVCRYCHTSN